MDKFILDSNAFITPYRQFYPFDFAPSFWSQLEEKLIQENVIVLDVVSTEIAKLEDDLSAWLKAVNGLQISTTRMPAILANYGKVLQYIGGSPLYKESALRLWSQVDVADSWIIAAAMEMEATIITIESKSGPISPRNPAKNAKIPDVAKHFGVPCEDLYFFMRKMNITL